MGDGLAPLSRPFRLHRVTPTGTEAEVETTAEERAAMAAGLGLMAIHSLGGRFRVAGSAERIRVTGRVRARVEQACVVTLDPFEAEIDEDVLLDFESPGSSDAAGPELELDVDRDLPEALVGDSIDLGAITAEFLALGLDPYPRKPGIAFERPEEAPGPGSPFAKLARLKPDESDR